MKRWDKRFLSSTRGRVVQLLRQGEATVNELATALELTDNAVRAHLTTLERDGLVQQRGQRAAARKPERLYVLTADAEQLFPKAYHLILNLLLDVLNEKLPAEDIEQTLQEVGHKLAALQKYDTGAEDTLPARLAVALDVLKGLGGLAELKEVDGKYMICGKSCPLAALVGRHPNVCAVAEAMLSELLEATVVEKCDRGETPRCTFEVG